MNTKNHSSSNRRITSGNRRGRSRAINATLCLVVGALTIVLLSGILPYIAGRQGRPLWDLACSSMVLEVLGMLLLVVSTMVLVSRAYARLLCWRQYSGQERLRAVMLFLGPPILVLAGCAWWVSVPGYIPMMYGFRSYVRRTVDVEAIRDWQATVNRDSWTEDAERCDRTGNPNARWPAIVRELRPVEVLLLNSGAELYFGGGPFHYGLGIGPKTMAVEAAADRHRGYYVLPVAQGVYLWCDTH